MVLYFAFCVLRSASVAHFPHDVFSAPPSDYSSLSVLEVTDVLYSFVGPLSRGTLSMYCVLSIVLFVQHLIYRKLLYVCKYIPCGIRKLSNW